MSEEKIHSEFQDSQPTAAPTYSSGADRIADLRIYEEREQVRLQRRQAIRTAAEGLPMWALLPLTILLGVFICEMVLRVSRMGIGATLSAACVFAFYTPMVLRRERRCVRSALLTGIPLALLCLSFALGASLSGRWIVVLGAIGLTMLTAAVMSGCAGESGLLSMNTVRDAVYVSTLAPLSNIVPAFGAVFSGSREKGKNRSGIAGGIGKVLIGLAISVPLVLILLAAMVSADAMFEEFIDNVLDRLRKLDIDASRIFGDLFAGLLFCLFALPMVLTLRAGQKRTGDDRKINRWLDPIIGATVAWSAAAVYILFVAVQVSYFFPVSISYYFEKYDFTERLTLPNDMTWAEYARSGFFELSGIIIASFVAIALFMIFCRRNEKGVIPAYLRTALTVIAGCNVIMALSAVMRMGLYTIWCGLTAARIGVLIIIGVIALSLVAVIVRLWAERFPLVRIVAAAAILALCCFGCMNVERVCANVNVARHIEQGTSIDICYLGNLSYAAAPAVERLMEESPDEDVRAAAAGILAKYYYYGSGCIADMSAAEALCCCSFGEMTLDHIRALDACRDESGEVWVTEDMIEDFGRYADWQDYATWFQRVYDEPCDMTLEEYTAEHTSWSFDVYDGW